MATFEGTATSNTSIIPASQTDYPEYVDLSNLPAAFWSTVKDGGGDIRCYSNSDLTTELPREVVSCDTTAETGELHVKHDLSAGDTIYIDVDGLRNDYATTDTFGAEAVWPSQFLADYHDGGYKDVTSNNNNTTPNGDVPTIVSGKIGDANDFDGTGDFFDRDNLTAGEAQGAVFTWVNADSLSNNPALFVFNEDADDSNNYLQLMLESDGSVRIFIPGGNTDIETTGTPISVNTDHRIAFVSDGTQYLIYVDGVQQSLTLNSGTNDGAWNSSLATYNHISIGALSRGTQIFSPFDGFIDETSVWNSTPSSNYATTEYNNQNSPSTFRTWAEVTGNPGVNRRRILNAR